MYSVNIPLCYPDPLTAGCIHVSRRTCGSLQDIDFSVGQNSFIWRRCKVCTYSSYILCRIDENHDSWGRILAATGSLSTLSSPIDPTKVSVSFVPSDNSSPLAVLVNGEPQNVDEVRAKEILEKEDFEVSVDLGGEGNAEAKYWTCDFSYVSLL